MSVDKAAILENIENYFKENMLETTYYSMGSDDKPKFGEIVLSYRFAGKEYSFDNQLGRVVQIRTGCGQFGSDMYFLRLPDGTLLTSENQAYRKIPDPFIGDVESHFTTDIDYEKEGAEEGFTIGGKQLAIGFIVDGKDTKGTPDESFSIMIAQQ
jgi:hypothetical protein